MIRELGPGVTKQPWDPELKTNLETPGPKDTHDERKINSPNMKEPWRIFDFFSRRGCSLAVVYFYLISHPLVVG